MLDKLKADWRAMCLGARDPSVSRLLLSCLTDYKFRILLRMRLSQSLIRRGFISRQIARHLFKLNCRYGVDISPYASIEGGLRLAHPSNIVIGDQAVVGRNARILQGATIGGSTGKVRDDDPQFTMPRLGNNVIVGPGAKVLGPILVGRGAFIAANAVVTRDVDKLNLVGGIPGKLLSTFTKDTLFPTHYEQMVSLDELFDEEDS